MIDSVIILEKILFDPPADKIYSRLGFRKSTTTLSAANRQETDRHIDEAASLIHLQGAFARLPIIQNDGQGVRLGDALYFPSEKLAQFLHDCREAVLMGATAGAEVLAAIREKTLEGDMTAAVVYDATASEMTDAALEWITDYLGRQIRRENRQMLRRRFSAGYADFALQHQKEIYEAIQLNKIGVSLTSGFMLKPEKSVTAVGGIM